MSYAGSFEPSLLSSAFAAFALRFSAGPVSEWGSLPFAASL